MSTPYDLERAAKAGGLGDDLDAGKEIALRLHGVFGRSISPDIPVPVEQIIKETVADVEDLYDIPRAEDQRGYYLAGIHGAVGAMLTDLIRQIRESRGLA